MALRSLTATEETVVKEILACGNALPYEFVATLDLNGTEVIDFRTDRNPQASDIGLFAVAEARRRRIVIRHNHLDDDISGLHFGRSLSVQDWLLLVNYPGVAEVSVHCTDGTSYRGAILDRQSAIAAMTQPNLEEAEHMARQALNAVIPTPPIAGHFTPPHQATYQLPSLLAMHAVGLALYAKGLIDYLCTPGPDLNLAIGLAGHQLTAAATAAQACFH